MAEDASAALLTPEIFGPEDAGAFDASGDPAPGGQGGGFVPTGGGQDLEGYGLDLASLLIFAFTGIPIPPAVLRVLLDGVIKLVTWIAGFFIGVPQQAKTVGVGQQLVHQTDPIAHWIGLNLIQAGAQGRVLSEGNWPLNFGGRLLAMGGSLITLANREPPGQWWHVRDTPAVDVARFNDDPRQFRLGPVPPPKGAPYTRSVIIDGFFAQPVLDPEAYKAKWGFDQPTPYELQQFLDAKRGILWDNQKVKLGRLFQMRLDFLDLWINAYREWLKSNPQPEPGQPPPPPSVVCKDPCQQEVINQLYSISLIMFANQSSNAVIEATLPLIQKAIENLTGGGSSDGIVTQLAAIAQGIKAADAPLMAILENLPLFIRALQSLSDPGVASQLKSLVDCVCPNLDKIAASLEKGGGGGGPDYTAFLKRMMETFDGSSPEMQGEAKRLDDLIHLAVEKYGFPADFGQIAT